MCGASAECTSKSKQTEYSSHLASKLCINIANITELVSVELGPSIKTTKCAIYSQSTHVVDN